MQKSEEAKMAHWPLAFVNKMTMKAKGQQQIE